MHQRFLFSWFTVENQLTKSYGFPFAACTPVCHEDKWRNSWCRTASVLAWPCTEWSYPCTATYSDWVWSWSERSPIWRFWKTNPGATYFLASPPRAGGIPVSYSPAIAGDDPSTSVQRTHPPHKSSSSHQWSPDPSPSHGSRLSSADPLSSAVSSCRNAWCPRAGCRLWPDFVWLNRITSVRYSFVL